ncbi:MAG: DUF3048 domain-containing protein [Patescibacteria group bacterium]|nr:DUF3048 domain-containing protein [Patescibacteria group bacterium]
MKKLKKTDKEKIKRIIFCVLIFIYIILMSVLLIRNLTNKKYQPLLKDNFSNQAKQRNNLEEKIENKLTKERAIDGILVKEDSFDFYPVAITIDNNVSAKPQAGLDKANLIIEAPVEGGITRFLAIFADGEDIDKIGPVRSARPYFLDWAKEFEALYCHVGGSPEALKLIKQKSAVLNLDQYYKSRYYWRSSKRSRPHNVFTSSELLNKALENYFLTEHNFSSLVFKNEIELEERGESLNNIIINFSVGNYNLVMWEYNRENNEYSRFHNGKPHFDENENVIKTKNLIIQKTKIISIDNEDRKRIKTIGNGNAIIFLDGKIIDGKWEKLSQENRTKFYDQNNEEIKFNRGKTWIEVVDENMELIY